MITDLCLMEPDPATKELTVVAIHEGVRQEQIRANTGWTVRFAATVATTPPPTAAELAVLREVQERTRRAHAGQAA